MTTTPLPPFSEQQLKDALSAAFPFDADTDGTWTLIESERRISEAVIAARDAQWQAYATQARADLEAENKRLRESLREIADDYADRFDLESPSTNPGIKYVIEQARAALEKQP